MAVLLAGRLLRPPRVARVSTHEAVAVGTSTAGGPRSSLRLASRVIGGSVVETADGTGSLLLPWLALVPLPSKASPSMSPCPSPASSDFGGGPRGLCLAPSPRADTVRRLAVTLATPLAPTDASFAVRARSSGSPAPNGRRTPASGGVGAAPLRARSRAVPAPSGRRIPAAGAHPC